MYHCLIVTQEMKTVLMFLIQQQTPLSSDRAQTQLRDQNRFEQQRLPAGFLSQRGRPLAFQIMQLNSEFQIQIEDKTCQLENVKT